MKQLSTLVMAQAVLASSLVYAQVAKSQRRPGGFAGVARDTVILDQKSVQEELKLTTDQTKEFEELATKQLEAFEDLPKLNLNRDQYRQKLDDFATANEKEVYVILQPEQQNRLKQIVLQRIGPVAFGDPKVVEVLKFNAKQKDSINTIMDDLRKAAQETFGGRGKGKPVGLEEGLKKREAMHKAAVDKVSSLLTAEQKTKWKELIGEPFKGEFQPGFSPQLKRAR